jgi:choline dehydrogenase-like flavoprotein
MVGTPNRLYQCNRFGELFHDPNIFIADGSLFSALVAKNYTFTLMANAMRIGEYVAGRIKR